MFNKKKTAGLPRVKLMGVAALLGATALVAPGTASAGPTLGNTWIGGQYGSWTSDENWTEDSYPDGKKDEAVFLNETFEGGSEYLDYSVDLNRQIDLNRLTALGANVQILGGPIRFNGPDASVETYYGLVFLENGSTAKGTDHLTVRTWDGMETESPIAGGLSIGEKFDGSILVQDSMLGVGYGTVDVPTIAEVADPTLQESYDAADITGRVTLTDNALAFVVGQSSLGSLAGTGSVYLLNEKILAYEAGDEELPEDPADLISYVSVGTDNSNSTFNGEIVDLLGQGSQTTVVLRKVGDGTFTIGQNANVLLGGIAVNGGKLVYNAGPARQPGGIFSLGAADMEEIGFPGPVVQVNKNGTLGGNGLIGGLVVNKGGTFAPGNSIGVMQVTGDVEFNAGSTYDVELDADGNSDLLIAGRNVTINGGTVAIDAAAGDYAPETDYVIIGSLDGTVAGEFDGITSNFAYLVPTLDYEGDAVIVHLVRANLDVGTTPNENAVEDQILSDESPLFAEVIGLSEEEARAALNTLSGEIHASAQSLFVEDSSILRDAALNRAGTEGSAAQSGEMVDPVTGEGLGLWGVIFAKSTELSDDGNAADLDSTTGGIIAGLDGVAGDWRLGALLSYGQTHASIGDDRDSSLDSDDYGFGVYAGTNWDDTKFKVGAAFANHFVSTERDITVGDLSDEITADYNATTAQVFAELSHEFALSNGTSIEPFAQIAVVGQDTEGFDEDGGDAALSVDGSTFRAALGTIGVRGSAEFALDGDMQVKLTGAIGYRHAFADEPEVENQFAFGDSFTVAGAPLVENALVLEAGVDFNLNANTNLNLSYKGQFGDDTAAHAAKATFSYSF